MKLIVQIPCKNEENTIESVVNELPKQIDGIDCIEYQIIDDGSKDKTVEIAHKLGIHHVISFTKNKGLGIAFKEGVENALRNGADIVVNTDGDNQYPGYYIKDLVKPIVDGEADIVIGNRRPSTVKYFSPTKKFFQQLGNKIISQAAGIKLEDSVSGFRAYNKNALLELNITSTFSYVVDTIVQAAKKGLQIEWVNIETNPPTRPSRLFTSIFQHIKQTSIDLIRVYIMYQPFKLFLRASIPFILIGLIGIARFIYYYLLGDGSGKVQSLVIGGIITQIGLTLIIIGIISDLIAKNRFLIEENLKMIKKMTYK